MSGTVSAAVRTPRVRVLANGAPLPGVTDADVVSNSHFSADRFRVTSALAAPDAAAWAGVQDALIEIEATLDGISWTSLIQGYADTVDIDPIGSCLRLAGRDLAALLIDSRTQETFSNQTASDVATTLAARHGLTPDVDKTTTQIGRYWQIEHDALTLSHYCKQTTEWDLLVTLARAENFDLWIEAQTLHFRAPSPSAEPFRLRSAPSPAGPPNVSSLSLDRSLSLARDIVVTVRSWNSRQAVGFAQTARAARGSARTSGSRRSQPLQYVFIVPNLTPDQALTLAQAHLRELTQHERAITAEMPGELALSVRTPVSLEGTASSFDQVYMIDEIERRLNFSEGFVQRVRARNTSLPSGGAWTGS